MINILDGEIVFSNLSVPATLQEIPIDGGPDFLMALAKWGHCSNHPGVQFCGG